MQAALAVFTINLAWPARGDANSSVVWKVRKRGRGCLSCHPVYGRWNKAKPQTFLFYAVFHLHNEDSHFQSNAICKQSEFEVSFSLSDCMRPHLIRNFTSLRLQFSKNGQLTSLLTVECMKLDGKIWFCIFPPVSSWLFGQKRLLQEHKHRERETEKKTKSGRESAEAICDVIFW